MELLFKRSDPYSIARLETDSAVLRDFWWEIRSGASFNSYHRTSGQAGR